jgi:hypothetical protein
MTTLQTIQNAFDSDSDIFVTTKSWPAGVVYTICAVNKNCFLGFNQETGEDNTVMLEDITSLLVDV